MFVGKLSPSSHQYSLLALLRLCRNPRSDLDVMLSKAKHLAFSSGYEVEILRLSPQNDIATQFLFGGKGER